MVATSGDGWVLAPALKLLVDQLNAYDPGRPKLSDGSIGDARHVAENFSDHNPRLSNDGTWYVTAVDISSAPWLDAWVQDVLTRDTRVKYLIRNKRYWQRIKWSGSDPLFTWVPYGGSNPHTHHVHISLQLSAARDTRRWVMPSTKTVPTTPEDDVTLTAAQAAALARIPMIEKKLDVLTDKLNRTGTAEAERYADEQGDLSRIEAAVTPTTPEA